ncbi:MAG: class I SAM-dependent methyltransferase [Gammaproteobacteria bacterium]|nr:class I SAM-dependent methyltransferase [Gammaproteobacteria bacterium]
MYSDDSLGEIVDGREIERALRGDILYGDDFSSVQIARWFDDEREGYFNLYKNEPNAMATDHASYEYEQLADQHCYKWLPNRRFDHALGIGSAHGAELKPILERSLRVTVLEPSDGFASTTIDGKLVTYLKPDQSGLIPFPASSFDIVVCFSVLHHIPNVTTVVNEMYRVLKPGGYALLREPTHSMGDWRKPRRGLTKNERGIPLMIFRNIVRASRFKIVKETKCMFSLMSRLSPLFGGRSVWTSAAIVRIDRILCALPIYSGVYQARHIWQKIRPSAVSFVLIKR